MMILCLLSLICLALPISFLADFSPEWFLVPILQISRILTVLVRTGGFMITAAYFGFYIERKRWKIYLTYLHLAKILPVAICSIIFGVVTIAANK